MKKKVLLFTAVFMVMTMAVWGCGSDEDKSEETTTEKTTEESTKKTGNDDSELDFDTLNYINDTQDEFLQTVLEEILGENESLDKIVYDMDFPMFVGDTRVMFKVVKGKDALGSDGQLKSVTDEAQEVVVRLKIEKEESYIKLNVLSKEDAAPVKLDIEAKNLIHNTDNIRGNITLRETLGENNEIKIEWTCDRPDLVTLEPTGENGQIPAGVVTRGANDEEVKLTATLSAENFSATYDFNLTIKAAPAKKEYSAYVYTYFRGNIYGNGESQHIHMATSKDGFFWEAINDNEPVLTAELGTKGVRDSFLVRSPEGDHFFLIGTDLDANGGDWGSYGGNGSRYVRVWESDDLVNWSEERLVLLAPENAACMWAPETTYDETTGEYVVYWSTGIKGGDGKKIWYAKTRDFYTFTEPQIYKNTENGTTFIDTSMVEYQGTYYRFTKNENELTILMETSDSVLGDYTLVKTKIAGENGVEGPACYKINGEEKWVLYMDGYTMDNAGVGYFPLIANSLEDLKTANFVRMEEGTFKMPEGAKHGSFVPITQEEYDALMAKWGGNN